MVSIIVAVAQNGIIGDKNSLLWHISEDMRFFKRTTSGHPVIMGRKTYDSLGRPLLNRTNVVISRTAEHIDGCQIARSLEEAIALFPAEEEVFIIGGAQIYALALEVADRIYAILNEGEEVIVFAPFFPEYRVFVEKAGGTLVSVKCDEDDFQPDLDLLEKSITYKTKAVIINSPNNPTGAVVREDTIKKIAELLDKKSKEYGNEIFIISDEPYRELVYDKDTVVSYIPKLYKNTLVCYSFSKSLSLPGERIGYVLVSDSCTHKEDVYYAICGAGRSLGYVCAPALFQYLIPKVLGKTSDIEIYRKNRDILYSALVSYGYSVVKPDGAFYLFVKSPESDAKKFCERAKKHELLLVPSDDFGYLGYVRISYCVATEMIEASLSAFERLIKEY